MSRAWAWLLLSFALAAPAPARAEPRAAGRVYFITGGGGDHQDSNVMEGVEAFKRFVARDYPGTPYRVIHNSRRQEVAAEILAFKAAGGGPVVVVGHSFGVQAAIDVAERLRAGNTGIDTLVSLDARHEWFHSSPEVIPENIARVVNFYETQDLLLQGIDDPRRADGSRRGIESTLVALRSGWGAHSALVAEVSRTGQLQAAVARGLSQPSAPAALAQLRAAEAGARAAAARPLEAAARDADSGFSGSASASGAGMAVRGAEGSGAPRLSPAAESKAEAGLEVPAPKTGAGSKPARRSTLVPAALGAAAGALLGLLGGPIGALIGAVVGALAAVALSRLA